MKAVNILHMNTGDGERSYAKNSSLQEFVIQKTLPVLKNTINDIVKHDILLFGPCFNIADLGCSSGTNTLLVVSNIIDMVREACEENIHRAPQFQVYLNDLYGNDFNAVFKLLPNFYANLKKEDGEGFGPCFVSAVPGSFYGQLFPDESLHLIYSSYSIHWLSQVPEGLDDNSLNIYMSKTSPPNVFAAYHKQYYADFTKFLHMRSKEIVHGGRMVLISIGRSVADPTSDDCCSFWDLLAKSLFDMVKEVYVGSWLD